MKGYTDKPTTELTDAQLLEETLQSAYDSGYYAAGQWASSPLHTEAIDRRRECFAEIAKRLATRAR